MVDITVERGLEIIEQGDRDIVVYEGRYGPSVIKPGNDSEGFAYMWSVEKDLDKPEDRKFRPAVSLSKEELRESLEETVKKDLDVKIVDPDVGNNPPVYTLFNEEY